MTEPSESPAPSASGSSRPEGHLARLIVLAAVGCGGAALWGSLDALYTLLHAPHASAAVLVAGAGHIVALYLPVGALLAVPFAVVERTRLWRETLSLLWHPRQAFGPNPALTARLAVALLRLSLLFGAMFVATRALLEHFHGRAAIALSLTALAVALQGVLGALGRLLGPRLEAWLLRRGGPLAAPNALLLLVGAALVPGLLLIRARLPQYPASAVLWGLLGLACCGLAARALGPLLGRRRWVAGGVIVGALAASWLSLSAYGAVEPSRALVENASVMASDFLHRYARALDADGDGWTAALGGGDCNDGDRSVHPGAADVPGDGVDSDCFAGDGALEVAPRGDGAPVLGGGQAARRNVLIIAVDALRRDHLGVNGYARDTSPELDAFAATATQYAAVVPPAPGSVMSFSSLFTGLYASEIPRVPAQRPGQSLQWQNFSRDVTTLPELLQGVGYQTAACVSTNYFDALSSLYRGFETIARPDAEKGQRGEATRATIAFLEAARGAQRPFFVWTHLMSPHAPYLGDGAPSRYGAAALDRYDTEIRLVDQELGELFRALERTGLQDDTVVVVASDHGEAFGEHHGVHFHGQHLYEEHLASVLFVRVPGLTRGGVKVSSPVSLLDVMPTVLDAVGVQLAHRVSGRSLLGCAEACDDGRLVFSERPQVEVRYRDDLRAIRRGSLKVIWNVRRNTFEAYDLAQDPAERHNLIGEPRFEELRGLLQHWVSYAALRR